MVPPKPKSALIFVLKGLIPYTRENLMLAFRPNQFFNELERISNLKRQALEQATRRAIEQGLIEEARNRQLKLTELGKRRVLPYVAEKLANDARLMIIFDVPEDQSLARQQLRRLLRKWSFQPIQKSVWITAYDFRELIKEAVKELELEGCVELYECSLLYPVKQ